MTDKDLQQEQESQHQETLAKQGKDVEESSPQEELTQAPIDAEEVEEEGEKSASEMVEEQSSTSEEVEEDSLFLSQWQKRHQEYLDSLKKQAEAEAPAEETKKKKSKHFSLKRHKLDELAEDSEEVPSSDKEILPEKRLLSSLALWKSMPVLFGALILALVSLYFMSPLSKEKHIMVTGNAHLDTNSILASSLISRRDYALTTWLNRQGHARNIKNSSVWVHSAQIDYEFPNKFTIHIKEYKEIGYQILKDKRFSVLSSGNISEFPTPQNSLPEKYTSIHLADRELVKKLVVQLAEVDSKIVNNIQSIKLTPSKASNDLLTLAMYDGHKILVPLADVKKKLPYYAKIVPQLKVPSTVDMEVGIFSYAN